MLQWVCSRFFFFFKYLMHKSIKELPLVWWVSSWKSPPTTSCHCCPNQSDTDSCTNVHLLLVTASLTSDCVSWCVSNLLFSHSELPKDVKIYGTDVRKKKFVILPFVTSFLMISNMVSDLKCGTLSPMFAVVALEPKTCPRWLVLRVHSSSVHGAAHEGSPGRMPSPAAVSSANNQLCKSSTLQPRHSVYPALRQV